MPQDLYCPECGVENPHDMVQGKLTCMVCGREPGKAPAAAPKKKVNKMAKLTETDKADILRRHGQGVATAVLAADFQKSEQCIRNVIKAGKAEAEAGPKAPKKGPKGKRGRKPAEKGATVTHGGLREAIEAAVDRLSDVKLQAFRLELPALVREILEAELKK